MPARPCVMIVTVPFVKGADDRHNIISIQCNDIIFILYWLNLFGGYEDFLSGQQTDP